MSADDAYDYGDPKRSDYEQSLIMRNWNATGSDTGSWRDRILDDGTDREKWLGARVPVVGASDAAKLARASSIPSVLAAKLSNRSFTGNSYTESGNRWEPMMLGWAGIAPNKALVHSVDEPGFAATPDGVQGLPAGGVLLAECKTKHNRVVFGPTLGEWRQLSWQFLTFPEAETLEFIWVELIDDELRTDLNGEPKHLTIYRRDPKVQDLLAQMLPLARDLLPQLRAALQFEKEMNAA